MTTDYKTILTDLFEKIARMRVETPSAGTKYRLMGLAADITEVAETFTSEVLERAKQEALLDADLDIDYDAMAEEVLAQEMNYTAECVSHTSHLQVEEPHSMVNSKHNLRFNYLFNTCLPMRLL